MNKRLWTALIDCQDYCSRGYAHYYWRTASMQKLAALGYVEPVPSAPYANAYKLTAAGEDALTKHHSAEGMTA